MKNLVVANLLGLLLLLATGLSHAEGVGVITHLSGVLQVKHADGSSKLLAIKSDVQQGDTLQTEKDTFARIKFIDNGEIVLRPETTFKVETYAYSELGKDQDNVVVSLLRGGLRSVTGLLGKRNPNRYKMDTPVATIGIRGTHFGALLCNNDCSNIPTISGKAPDNGLHTDTAQGSTIISNAKGTIEIPAGSFSYTADAGSPPKLVPPSQGVQVTMPQSISSNKDKGQGMGDNKGDSCAVH